MRVTYVHSIFMLALSLLVCLVHARGSRADSVLIQSMIQQQVVTWNKADAKGYSQDVATDGSFTNILGMFFTGQKAFEGSHQQIFTCLFRSTIMQQKIISLKFMRSDVAVVETITWSLGFSKTTLLPSLHLDAKGRLRTRLLQVMVKEKEDWKIVAYHNVDIKTQVPIEEP